MGESALIIFVKNPILGQVKTRLAKDLGDKEALSIYQTLLEHTRLVTHDIAVPKYLYYSNHIETNDAWHPADFDKRVQRGMDLGERMLDAFIEVLSFHKKVVIIGSDCIDLQKKHIAQAFEALNNKDVVIGPSQDGGYYLMGMKQNLPSLFIGIPFSSGSEYGVTRQRVLSSGRTLFNLEILNDIDHSQDWQDYLDSK